MGNNRAPNLRIEIGKHAAYYQTPRADVHAVYGKHEAYIEPLKRDPEIKEAEHLTCVVLAE